MLQVLFVLTNVHSQMDNGGVIIFMSLGYNEYGSMGEGFYGTIINNILSYATLGTGGGDPHIVGFDKSSLDLLGSSGDVFNIITDQDLQVNTRLWTPEGNIGELYKSFMGAMAFMTAAGDTIVVDAGAHDVPATVTINGEVLSVDEVTSMEGLSFHMERTRTVPKVPMMLGSSFGSEPTNALIIRFERYAFEIYFVRAEGQFANLYFVDFEVRSPAGHLRLIEVVASNISGAGVAPVARPCTPRNRRPNSDGARHSQRGGRGHGLAGGSPRARRPPRNRLRLQPL